MHKLDPEIISKEIIGFLNKWKCRLPYSITLAEGIRKQFAENVHIIEALKHTTITEYNPKEKIEIDGAPVSVTGEAVYLRWS